MSFVGDINERIKKGIKEWLDITSTGMQTIIVKAVLDFEMHSARNRIWYRGDSNELEQMYQQMTEYADRNKFWASKCTPGMEMRKIHTGLPGLIVKVLAAVVLPDMNEFDFENQQHKALWDEIAASSKFEKKLEKALRETLYIGDGAWKITIDTKKSDHPVARWYPGDRVEFTYDEDKISEVIFKTPYVVKKKKYTLYEYYGYGYVRYELYKQDELVPLKTIDQLAGLTDTTFDDSVILAVPVMAYESAKYEGRGGSIFDGKLDSFDAFDEIMSQWMDALRTGRARTYIPDSYIPRDPKTGELMRPNAFDNKFIAGGDNMDENGKNMIITDQPDIPHESYAATYSTALDLCLQGIISPSTLGVDVKKLDNAEAQREKEKVTLYTRNTLVDMLQRTLKELVTACIHADNLVHKKMPEEVKVDITFGEYASPSFEGQVETLSKGKQGGIMSIEACVDELYGDSRDEAWKQEEVARLKFEQGITELDEPAVNMAAGEFTVMGFTGGSNGDNNQGKSSKQNVQDEPEGVPGTAEGGK